MNTAPEISVIIPTYNRVELLASSLRSLEEQSLPAFDFEVVVVDDGSTDETRRLCLGWEGDLRLRYLRQANSGSAVAKNLGLFAAEAPLVLFFDDDDAAGAGLLEEHLAAHSAYPDERVAILNFTTWHPSLSVTPVMDYLVNVGQLLFSYPSIRPDQELGWQHFWTGRISCKRRFLTHHGVFSPRMRRLEDVELGFRLARSGLVVRYWPRAKSYMLRPITFHDFCVRAEKDGHARAVFKHLHPTPEVERYCFLDQHSYSSSKVEPSLQQLVEAVAVVERLIDGAPHGGHPVVLDSLHRLYQVAFAAFGVKGFGDGEYELAVD